MSTKSPTLVCNVIFWGKVGFPNPALNRDRGLLCWWIYPLKQTICNISFFSFDVLQLKRVRGTISAVKYHRCRFIALTAMVEAALSITSYWRGSLLSCESFHGASPGAVHVILLLDKISTTKSTNLLSLGFWCFVVTVPADSTSIKFSNREIWWSAVAQPSILLYAKLQVALRLLSYWCCCSSKYCTNRWTFGSHLVGNYVAAHITQ